MGRGGWIAVGLASLAGLAGCRDRSGEPAAAETTQVRPATVGGRVTGDEPDLDGVDQLALGFEHGCALRAGEVYCWGEGIGGGGSGPVAGRVDGLPPIAELRSAGRRTCALSRDGQLFCWGERLGGKSRGREGEVFVHGSGPPPASLAIQWGPLSRIDLGRPVAQVAVGMTHICARTEDRALYCWGSASGGQLRDKTPIEAPERTAEAVEDVEVGHGWTCYQIGDKRRCFGAHPRLGEHTQQQQNFNFPGWIIASCGLREGTVRCQGRSRVVYGGGEVPEEPGSEIVTVPGIDRARQLTLGSKHACALRDDGSVWCWGDSTFGQSPGWAPAAIELPGPATRVDAGLDHTCAIIAADRSVVCWGVDKQGQSGGEVAPSPVRYRPEEDREVTIPVIETRAATRHALESKQTPKLAGTAWKACLRQPRNRECSSCRYTLRFEARGKFVAEGRCTEPRGATSEWTGRWRQRGDGPISIAVKETPAPAGTVWNWTLEIRGHYLSGARRIDEKVMYFVEGQLE